ncbi:hypothetical protein AB0H58_08915 [Nocardia neocaledoniensis]|uniref:Uncharacterized protein n=1 Tax=Nocardia neocaledoniensis TaxID=236511 RepID=A0A317NFM1_9NOCA|nr:hypothetical protein [Nocardia neocaledoniensis]PWV73644.1 hypothetical protein DFR69_107271 [Nocardia neocaledoniensis]
MRFGVTSTALGTGFVAAGVILGAGSAAAFAPQAQPDRIGAQLNHEETVALGAGPIPALTAMFVPANRIGAGLHSETNLHRDADGGIRATLRQVVTEAASHPDGTVTVYLNAPGARGGRVVDVYQQWAG